MSGVSGVGSANTTEQLNKTNNTDESSSSSSSSNGAELIDVGKYLKNGLSGEGVGDLVQDVQKDISTMIKSAIVGALKRLFIGNDQTDAVAGNVKTKADAVQSKASIAAQQFVFNSGLQAIQDLVQNGSININQFAQQVQNVMKSINDKNVQAQTLSDQKQEIAKQNEELAAQIQELGGSVEGLEAPDQTKGGSSPAGVATPEVPTAPAKNGSKTQVNTENKTQSKSQTKTQSNSSIGNSSDNNSKLQDLIQQYQTNLGIMATYDSQIAEVSKAQTQDVQTGQGVQNEIQAGKDQLTSDVTSNADGLISKVVGNVYSNVTKGNATLKTGQISGTVEGTVDTTTAASAPGIAAGLTAGTLGLGSAEAAKVVANGVADGVATGFRSAQLGSAVGGIATNIMQGKTIEASIAQVAQQQINGAISTQINSLAQGFQIGDLDLASLVTQGLENAEGDKSDGSAPKDGSAAKKTEQPQKA